MEWIVWNEVQTIGFMCTQYNREKFCRNNKTNLQRSYRPEYRRTAASGEATTEAPLGEVGDEASRAMADLLVPTGSDDGTALLACVPAAAGVWVTFAFA